MLKLENFQKQKKKRVDEVILPTPLIYSEAFSAENKIKFISNQKTCKEQEPSRFVVLIIRS